jgi:hypothetical protein
LLVPELGGACLTGGRFPNYLRRESSVGYEAAFDFASFNGRALGDDVMDVIINLASNAATADGVATDQRRIRADFPSGRLSRPRSRREPHPPLGGKKAREATLNTAVPPPRAWQRWSRQLWPLPRNAPKPFMPDGSAVPTTGCRQSLGAETRRQELALGAAAGSALAGEALLNNS